MPRRYLIRGFFDRSSTCLLFPTDAGLDRLLGFGFRCSRTCRARPQVGHSVSSAGSSRSATVLQLRQCNQSATHLSVGKSGTEKPHCREAAGQVGYRGAQGPTTWRQHATAPL